MVSRQAERQKLNYLLESKKAEFLSIIGRWRVGKTYLTKEEANKLRRRKARFQQISKTKKTIFNTIITTYGINVNQHSIGQVDHCVTMDALFLLENFE